MIELVRTVAITAVISSAISAIIGAAVASLISRAKVAKQRSDADRQEREDMRELLLQNTKMTCRMVIYDEHFDMDEKIEAYIIYRSHRWNHRTKQHMDMLLGCDVDEYLENFRDEVQ